MYAEEILDKRKHGNMQVKRDRRADRQSYVDRRADRLPNDI